MRNALVLVFASLLPLGSTALAQSTGSGKIFCWKNKAGKTECGDSIPVESGGAAVRELNKRGVTVGKKDAELTPEQKRVQQAELERKKAEDLQREEQRRKDKALMDTFSNEKEIDLKRGRDVQLLESNIETLQSNIKNMNDRIADTKARTDVYARDKRAVPQPLQDEMERLNRDKANTERQIAQKRKEIASLHQTYDDMKKRYAELSGTASAPAPKVAPAPAPEAKKAK